MQTESLQELSLRTDNLFSTVEIRGVLANLELPLTSPYPYDKISDLQAVNNFESVSPHNRVVVVYYTLRNRFASSKDDESELNMALFMQRVEQDTDALNWLLHSELCDRWVAGNDLNLIDMVLMMRTDEKMALLYAMSNLNQSGLMSMRYGGLVDQSLQSVCDYVSQPRCQSIDYLPVNFELTYFSTSLINTESGAPGSSAVMLNASPLNTLPRGIFYEMSQRGGVDSVSEGTRQSIMRFRLATELSHELAYAMLSEFFNDCMTSEDFRREILAVSKGTVGFDDIYTTEWNVQYPALTAEIADFYKISAALKGGNALSGQDNASMNAAFSKYMAYGSIDGLSRVICKDLFNGSPSFMASRYISPGPSLLHNFSHLDAPYGREQIDAYIDHYQDVILSGYLSRYSSIAAGVAQMGERLLAYLDRMYEPTLGGESSGSLYHYALAKVVSMTLLRGQALGVFDPKHLSMTDFMRQAGMSTSLSDRQSAPFYNRHLLEQALRGLPAELRPLDVLLCCGISASAEELTQASEDQLLRSLTQDLGM